MSISPPPSATMPPGDPSVPGVAGSEDTQDLATLGREQITAIYQRGVEAVITVIMAILKLVQTLREEEPQQFEAPFE